MGPEHARKKPLEQAWQDYQEKYGEKIREYVGMVVFPDPFMHYRENTSVLGLREKIGPGLGEAPSSHLLVTRVLWTDFEKAKRHGFKTLEGVLIEASLRRLEELVEPSLRFIKLFALVESFMDDDLEAIVHIMGGYIIAENSMERGGTGKTIDLNPKTGREKYPYELFWFPYEKPPHDLDPTSRRVLEQYKSHYKKKASRLKRGILNFS